MVDEQRYGFYVNDRLDTEYPNHAAAFERIAAVHQEAGEAGYWVTEREESPTATTMKYRRSRRDSELPASFGGGGPSKFTLAIRPLEDAPPRT